MKTPTLEEVKAYFKDAKEVRSADLPSHKEQVFDISDRSIFDNRQIHFYNDCYWLCKKEIDNIMLWNCWTNEFAEILSYKSTSNIDLSKLTTELITELCKDEKIKDVLVNNGVVKNELPITGWFKTPQSYGIWLGYYENNILKYIITDEGFEIIKKNIKRCYDDYIDETLATPQEVETALKNEAVRREYKNGNYKCLDLPVYTEKNVKDNFFLENNKLWHGSNGCANCVFDNGVWATIIPQEETYIKIPLSIITLTDSKKKLGALVKSIAENY